MSPAQWFRQRHALMKFRKSSWCPKDKPAVLEHYTSSPSLLCCDRKKVIFPRGRCDRTKGAFLFISISSVLPATDEGGRVWLVLLTASADLSELATLRALELSAWITRHVLSRSGRQTGIEQQICHIFVSKYSIRRLEVDWQCPSWLR